MADSITTKNPATQTATVAKTNTPVKAKNPKDILFEQISISENYLNEGLSSEEDNFSFGGTIGRNLFLGSLGTVSAFQEVSQHYDKKGNYRQALKELAELRTQIAKGEISLENAKIKLQEIDQKLIQKQDTIRQYTVDAANAKAVGAGIVAVGAGIGVAVLAPQVAAGLLLGVEVTGITITTAGIVATTTAGTQITLTAAQATSFLALTGAITTGYSATTQVVTEGVNGNLNKPETWKAIAGQALIEGTVNVAFLGLEPFGKLMNPKIMKTLGIMGVSPDVATKAAPLLSDLTFFTGTGITSGTAEYYLTLALNPSLTAEEKQKLMNEKGVQIMASALLGVGFRAVLRGVSKNGNSARTTLTASQKELKPDDANELNNLVIQIIKKADLNDDSQKPLIQALNGVRDKLKNNNSIALDDLTFIIQQSNKYGLEKEVNQLIPKIDPSLAKLITIAQKLEKGTITADDVIELENLAKNNGVPKSQIEEVKALVRDTENSASGSIKVRQAPTAPLQAVTTSKTTSVLPKATTTPTSVTPWNAPKPPIGANNIVPFNAPKAPTHLERILNDLTPQQKSKLGELSPAQMERFNGIIQSNINNRITLGEENPVIKQEVIDGALNMAKSGSEVPLSMTMMAGSGQTDDLINALKKIETQTQTPADEAKTRYGATTYTPQSLAITTTEDWKANIEERIIKLITNGNNFIVYQNCEKPDRWIAGVKQVLDALGLNFEVYSFPSSEPNKTSIILKLLSSPSQAQTGTIINPSPSQLQSTQPATTINPVTTKIDASNVSIRNAGDTVLIGGTKRVITFADLESFGLVPKHEAIIKISGTNHTILFSNPVKLGDTRTGFVIYFQDPLTKQWIPRPSYRSASHGISQIPHGIERLPDGNTNWLGKGIIPNSKSATAVPTEIDEVLAELEKTQQILDKPEIKQVVFGLAKNTIHAPIPVHPNNKPFSQVLNHKAIDLQKQYPTLEINIIAPNFGSMKIPQALKPNFAKAENTYTSSNPVYGELQVETYLSNDGKYLWTMLKQISTNRVWVGGLNSTSSPLETTGLLKEIPDIGLNLSTAPLEYTVMMRKWEGMEQSFIDDFGQEYNQKYMTFEEAENSNSYRDVWSLVKENPVIQDYYKAKGITEKLPEIKPKNHFTVRNATLQKVSNATTEAENLHDLVNIKPNNLASVPINLPVVGGMFTGRILKLFVNGKELILTAYFDSLTSAKASLIGVKNTKTSKEMFVKEYVLINNESLDLTASPPTPQAGTQVFSVENQRQINRIAKIGLGVASVGLAGGLAFAGTLLLLRMIKNNEINPKELNKLSDKQLVNLISALQKGIKVGNTEITYKYKPKTTDGNTFEDFGITNIQIDGKFLEMKDGDLVLPAGVELREEDLQKLIDQLEQGVTVNNVPFAYKLVDPDGNVFEDFGTSLIDVGDGLSIQLGVTDGDILNTKIINNNGGK